MTENRLLVIMPVYNSENTLEKAIKSILTQSFKKLNLVIVDDASTDGSLEIAKKFLSDPRVSVYKNKINMGAYYSRNFGLYVSKNLEWTHFTTHDADDISFRTRYKHILKVMSVNPRILGAQDTFDRINLATKEVISSKLTMAHAVFKREVFDIIGYFDTVRFGGDWEYWTRLKRVMEHLDKKQLVISINEVMGESFIHDTNLTVLIPENSDKRKTYIARSLKKISRVIFNNAYRYKFDPEPSLTSRVLL